MRRVVGPSTLVLMVILALSACGAKSQGTILASSVPTSHASSIPITKGRIYNTQSIEDNYHHIFECDREDFLYKTKKCVFFYSVTNITNFPQEFTGNAFAISGDGKIYEDDGSTNEVSVRLNPGETSNREPEFTLPVGTKILKIFKAVTASSEHYYDVTLDVTIK